MQGHNKRAASPEAIDVPAVHLVGKEGNRIDEISTGEAFDPEEVLTDYGDDEWEQVVVPAARAFGIRRLARDTGLARSKLTNALLCRSSPNLATRVAVTEAIRCAERCSEVRNAPNG